MLTYLLPTHNRAARLHQTLAALGSLSADEHERLGGAEVFIVDNASDPPIQCPPSLRNGWPVRVIRLTCNHAAAARNIGVKQARGEWIVMLDDDSYPLHSHHVDVLLAADDDIAAIGAEITLPNGQREAGGLPEVFIGCGVAIRRSAFLNAGGYDPAFDYYAEEYDLCARLILNGWRIMHDRQFQIRHEKVTAGRDMNRILHRLVRNNGWVAQRYAPSHQRDAALAEIISRYGRIAMKEHAAAGFASGVAELLATLDQQPPRTMPQDLFDRFTGIAHVRQSLPNVTNERIAIVDEGKNAWAVRQALRERDIEIVGIDRDADLLVIGTLSPGPMLDALDRHASAGQPIIAPWHLQGRDDRMFAVSR